MMKKEEGGRRKNEGKARAAQEFSKERGHEQHEKEEEITRGDAEVCFSF